MVAAAALVVAASAPAAAQDVDARWLPWVGCWQGVDAPADDPMLCVRPSTGGVELLTVSRGEVRETTTLRADDVERPSEAEGCAGTERTRFSADGSRLYRSSDLECGGGIGRVSSRMWAMVSPAEWIDVRAIDVDGQGAAWVERYRSASPDRVEAAGLADLTAGRSDAIESARLAASAPIDVDDLIEAHAVVGDEVLKSWVAERGEPIRLDADRLVRLADAGVDADVIDVLVAVSYPERFAVAREPRGAATDMGRRYPIYLDPWAYGPYSFYGNRFYSPYYGYYGYGRYGYGFGSGYGYGGYRNPTVIVVRPVDPAGGSGGRMVKGRGYTRPGENTGSVLRPSQPRTGATSASPATRSTGSKGAATSGSKPRTAKPRGGGS